MSQLLYGSSNVYRHISRIRSGPLPDFELIRCTNKVVFDAHVADLGNLPSGSIVVTSVLSNFIVDACQGLDSAEVPLFASQVITAHVEALAALLRTSEGSQVFVVPPLRRLIPGMSYEKKAKEIPFMSILDS
jgi:hypothetical protein